MAQLSVSHHPVVQDKLALLRAQDTPPEIFRKLIYELSLLIGVEATTDLLTGPSEVQTPLQMHTGQRLTESVALVPILRAGLGMVDGLAALLPRAPVRHLGFYRNEETLEPVAYYSKTPEGRCEDLCLVLDPMLATGGSAVAALDQVKKWGAKRLKFLAILGAPEGVETLRAAHPDVDLHLCVLDEKLNSKGYILPGLGDAGDRLYNT
jgi:uracil phosphoribosyltransferase